jgi:GDP-4-dehydro-6-deoxy-D-mannose reductase
MNVLITGISGFVGSHLADLLLEKGFEVHGSIRWRSKRDNITHLGDKIQLHECDIKDSSSIRKTIFDTKPRYIYHLAAQSYVHTSWAAPGETLLTNIQGQLYVLETMRDIDWDCRCLVVGSSEEYGMVREDELPITEDNALRPLSPYGVSKVTQDLLAYQYHQSFGTDLVRTRAFNHTGPRRGEVFVTSNFAKQIAEIEIGKREPVIMVGNLEAQRDFTDVRDMVKAYLLAMEMGRSGEVYNICSGQAIRIRELLDRLLKLTDAKVEVKQDPARMRPSDVMVLQGSAEKFRKETGWEPEIPFGQTLCDLLDFWRERV